ncbi:MAG: hypothetical protein ACAI44_03470, partial [Candidatus Sericytochromatia bacterium]
MGLFSLLSSHFMGITHATMTGAECGKIPRFFRAFLPDFQFQKVELMTTKDRIELDRVTIRFAGDSGDG